MLKRVSIFFLILALTLPLFGAVPAMAASSGDAQLVADLGIIDLSENVGLFPKSFTRGDFARSICVMMQNSGMEVLSKENASLYATDIETNANLQYIAYVISVGYLDLDSEGRFNPSQPITLEDALKALIKLLGYEKAAAYEGGYNVIAQRLRLTKGVTIADNKALTAEETAKILANAMSVKFFSSDSIDLGSECLYDAWGVLEYSGCLLANSNIGLMVDRTNYKRINVDGNIYHTDLLVPDELVGCDVTFYTIEENDVEKVVSIRSNTVRENITLNFDDIYSVTDNGSTLKVSYDENKVLTVDKKGFMLVNGKTQTPSKKVFDAFSSGTVTFIDTDGDRKYDVIHMNLFYQTVIQGANADTLTLATKFDDNTIDLNDVEVLEVYLGKKAVALGELTSGMPVGIVCDAFTITDGQIECDFSKATYIKLYASNRKTTGYISSLLDDGFEIDGITKDFGTSYYRYVKKNLLFPLNAGDYVTAYYDNMGRLSYYEYDTSVSDMRYGYILAGGTDGSAFSSSTAIKLLDMGSEYLVLNTGDTFILDGKKVDAGSVVYTVNSANDVDLSKRQVIRYRTADGVLKEIDTKVVRNGVESADNTIDEVLAFDPNKNGNATSRVRGGVINKKFAFAKDCYLFTDEASMDDTNPPEKLITVKKITSLSNVDYYIGGYDSDENNLLSCIVNYSNYNVKDDSSEAVSGIRYSRGDCYVVERVSNIVDEDGEPGWKIKVAGSNKTAEYIVPGDYTRFYATKSADDWGKEPMSVYRQDLSTFGTAVAPGDLVRFETNTAGNISRIDKVFDFSDHKDSIAEVPNKGGHIYGFVKLERIVGDYIIYSYGDDEVYLTKKTETHTSIPLYHVSTGKVEMMSLADIPTAMTGNDVKVFVRFYDYGNIWDHLFYIYD